jgi:hypothetical protein
MTEIPHDRQRWLLSRSARLHEVGAEPVSGLVLPTGDFFPDVFDRTRAAVERLLARVSKLAGLSDLSVDLSVVESADDPFGGDSRGSCSSGGCSPGGRAAKTGRLRRVEVLADEGYRVAILPQEAGHPVVLTTTLVRAVSEIFLHEAGAWDAFELRERDVAIDLVGTALGFGVLLCNGSYIYSKGCGGVSVASATKMPVEELALALAIQVVLHGLSPRQARKHLDTTPAAHFEAAHAWALSNARVIDLVRSDRAAVDAGSYSLSEGRGWFSRLLGVGRAKGASAPTEAELERSLSERWAAEKVRRAPADESRAQRMAALAKLVEDEL